MQAFYMYVVLLLDVIIKTWIDLLRRDCSAVALNVYYKKKKKNIQKTNWHIMLCASYCYVGPG